MLKVNLTKKQINKLEKNNLNLIVASYYNTSQGIEYIVKICRKDNKNVWTQGTSNKNLETALNNAIKNFRNAGKLMS